MFPLLAPFPGVHAYPRRELAHRLAKSVVQFHGLTNLVPVQRDDVLPPRIFLFRVAEQVEPLQYVEEQRMADGEDSLSGRHSIILGDHALLSVCKCGMRRDLKSEMPMPKL